MEKPDFTKYIQRAFGKSRGELRENQLHFVMLLESAWDTIIQKQKRIEELERILVDVAIRELELLTDVKIRND